MRSVFTGLVFLRKTAFTILCRISSNSAFRARTTIRATTLCKDCYALSSIAQKRKKAMKTKNALCPIY